MHQTHVALICIAHFHRFRTIDEKVEEKGNHCDRYQIQRNANLFNRLVEI